MSISTDEILFHVENNIGWITLNRPKYHNALSSNMIHQLYQILKDWEFNSEVKMISLEGAGEKAFCSGGDVRNLYDHQNDNIEDVAFEFFSSEYQMNYKMHTYPKPILVYMNGYVMGGGVGIAIGNDIRIVNERTRWAMPEMDIGLYPDVGGTYFLSRMPRNIGRYLALTSKVIGGKDALYIGAADVMIESSRWEEIRNEMLNHNWNSPDLVTELKVFFKHYENIAQTEFEIYELDSMIEQHFKYTEMEEIVASLKQAVVSGNEWAKVTLEILHKKSPTSQKVTLEQLIRGEKLDLKACFKVELNMSMNFMKNHDFFEGVRSVLVDKDHSPKWKPDVYEDVSRQMILSYFDYDWKEGKNPLEQM